MATKEIVESGIIDITGVNTVHKKVSRRLKMKYILQWTPPKQSPFYILGEGQTVFIENNCSFSNCYITGDRNLLFGDYRNFDAVAFNGHVFNTMRASALPQKRSMKQKYIFADMESADNYPSCQHFADGFFNWTFTYKLDSDIPWHYFLIYDKNNTEIGPRKGMNWLKDMDPICKELQVKVKSKTKAAAWFVSNCYTIGGREDFIRGLQSELKQYNLSVDIFGSCGQFECPRSRMHDCYKLLERDYYFYFSMENSFSEDYVTEKLLHALHHNTVPVVFGGANYTRFENIMEKVDQHKSF